MRATSYTQLTTFQQCPRRFEDQYILKNRYPNTVEQEEGIKKHEILADTLRTECSLPDDLASAGPMVESIRAMARVPGAELLVEQQFALDQAFRITSYFGPSSYFRGPIDVAVVFPEQRMAWLGDWKTGKRREKPLQLRSYSIFLLVKYGLDVVKACNLWLMDGEVGEQFQWTKDDLPIIRLSLASEIDTLDKAIEHGEFPARPSHLCPWCPVPNCDARRAS